MLYHIQSLEQFSQLAKNKSTVLFSAKWCPSCMPIKEQLHVLSREYPEKQFLLVDVDECDELAIKYNVQKLPTIYKGTTEKFIQTDKL